MEHFTAATRIINEVQESLFPRLESCRDEANVNAIEGAIDERVKHVGDIVERLEIAVNKATPAQRSSLKFKLDQIRYLLYYEVFPKQSYLPLLFPFQTRT